MDYPSAVIVNDESAEVILINTDGTERTQLTFTEFPFELGLAWSPDATKIATTQLDFENDCIVYLLGVDGSGTVVAAGAVNITDVPGSPLAGRPEGDIREPDWSRGSDRIALTARGPNGDADIWVVDLTNPANPVNFTGGIDANSDTDASWSPDDGRLVLWRSGNGTRAGIYTINGNGTGLKQLTRGGSNPDWKRVP
jgi:Tol biopolymer transport system component